MAADFLEPGPLTVVVGVTEGQDIFATRGLLQCLSPLEMAHALLLSVAKDIHTGVGEPRLMLWRQMLLSITFVFELLPPNMDTLMWRVQELRHVSGIAPLQRHAAPGCGPFIDAAATFLKSGGSSHAELHALVMESVC